MLGFFKKIFGGASATPTPQRPARFGMSELTRRLGIAEAELRNIPISYTRYEIPKRRGGTRVILAPSPQLKSLQRRILRRLLSRLKSHSCATGFERGHSIVTNALPHVGKDVVIKLDLKEFFTSTSAARVEQYFRFIGWDADSAAVLTRICTYEKSLPQGAPTSPRLSNLVNHLLDARLCALAASRGASYSRYADDITFSAAGATARRMNPKTNEVEQQSNARINDLIHATKQIVRDFGYTLHTDKKLRIARKHDRQIVTGIVVNAKPNLPRRTRRKLRAVEHRIKTGAAATMTPQQLQGWKALQAMVTDQSAPSD
jgi:retron-type reverse transcriptase